MRRVLVLNHFAVQQGAPGGTRHVELFDRLPKEWEYTIIAADRKGLTRNMKRPGAGNVVTVRTTPSNGNGASRVTNWLSYAFGAFFAGVRQRDIDVVYGSSPHLLTALVAWKIAWLRRVPFILEIRDLWPKVLVDMGKLSESSPTYRSLAWLERFLYRRADQIVVLAKGTAEHINAMTPEASITSIPNGSDPAMWELQANRDALRDDFGWSGLVAIYAGAHGPANGLDAVLDAAAEIPDATFVLVGGGIDKQRLVQEAQIRGLPNVDFRDPVPKAELARIFAASDCGLHVLADVPLFRYGVSPNKLFDYMAAGLPVITNCPGEVSDLVVEAGAGVPCAPDDLADAVGTVMVADTAQRMAWGENGRTFIIEHRSREVLAADLVDVLERATGGG